MANSRLMIWAEPWVFKYIWIEVSPSISQTLFIAKVNKCAVWVTCRVSGGIFIKKNPSWTKLRSPPIISVKCVNLRLSICSHKCWLKWISNRQGSGWESTNDHEHL